jgi:hypothetical protein
MTAPIPTPTDAPNVGAYVGQAAGLVSNGITTGYGVVLGYAIPLAILFTVVCMLWAFLARSGGGGADYAAGEGWDRGSYGSDEEAIEASISELRESSARLDEIRDYE